MLHRAQLLYPQNSRNYKLSLSLFSHFFLLFNKCLCYNSTYFKVSLIKKIIPDKILDSCDCGVKLKDSILGGSAAPANSYPYFVNIYKDKEQDCGGSLINDQYILTAATCVRVMFHLISYCIS